MSAWEVLLGMDDTFSLYRSKAYFNNLLENVLLWLASHRSYGVKPEFEEYLQWESKLTLACMLIRELLENEKRER